MIQIMISLFEFFDVTFLRMAFNLLVDYLVSSGYLLPVQRQQWVDGYAHIIGILGAVIFMALWQHQSNKKKTSKPTVTMTQNIIEKPQVATQTTSPVLP